MFFCTQDLLARLAVHNLKYSAKTFMTPDHCFERPGKRPTIERTLEMINIDTIKCPGIRLTLLSGPQSFLCVRQRIIFLAGSQCDRFKFLTSCLVHQGGLLFYGSM